MKILITTNTIPDKTGTYIVLKNIIPYLMENNEVTILTNQCDVDIKCNQLVQLSTSNIFSQYFFVIPIILIGLTALSELIKQKNSTLF